MASSVTSVLWFWLFCVLFALALNLGLSAVLQMHKARREAGERLILVYAASHREEDRVRARSIQQELDDDDYLRIQGFPVWFATQLRAFGLWLLSCPLGCLCGILACLNDCCRSACACARAVLHRRKQELKDEERPDPPSPTAEPVVYVQPGQLLTMTIRGGGRRQNHPGSEESGKSDKQA
jgi:hypothetical protein